MNPTRPLVLLGALCALSVAAPAQATLYCVGNGAQLKAALTDAQTYDSDDEIRIGTGYMNAPGPFGSVQWRYEAIRSDDLKVSGGWNYFGGCNTQDPNPLATRIAGGSFGPAFEVQVNAGTYPTLGFSNFTVEDGAADDFGTGGFAVRTAVGSAPIVTVERLALIGNVSFNGNGAGLEALVLGGTVSILGCWITDNVAYSSAGAKLSTAAPGVIYFNNNTVRGNASNNPSGYAGVGVFNGGPTWLSNNVIVDNLRQNSVPTDLRMNTGSNTLLSHNHIGSLSGTPGFQSNNTTGDPKLDAASTYDLPLAASPLRNSGTGVPAGGLPSAGFFKGQRVQGGVVDRGAFEFEELFTSGFE